MGSGVRAKEASEARHLDDEATHGVVPALPVPDQTGCLSAGLARLLGAGRRSYRDLAVLLRTLGELATALRLSRCLEPRGVSWKGLEQLVHGLASRGALEQTVAAFSSEANERIYVVPDIHVRNLHLLQDVREEADFKETADRAIGLGRSFLYYDRLYTLYESLRNLTRLYPTARLSVAEVGVYQGGTSFFLCDVLRKLHASHARFYSIDTFEGHSAIDLPSGTEGLHSPREFGGTSFEEASDLLSEFPFATVIKSRIQECTDSIESHRFHFVHLDVDIYEPTLFSLNFFLPRMVVGGIICVDDYNKTSCPGVKQAVEQVLADGGHSIIRLYTQTAQCLLVRAGAIER
jgi:hypothetical protein